ncbi:MAG: OstA-like protein [Bacteroidota bacterium]
MNCSKYTLIPIFFLLFSACIFSQEKKKIQILHADAIDYDEETLGKDIKRLVGNVKLMHEDAIMDCDSAYFNSKENNVRAFSNIHINQKDSMHLYGDSLKYDGNKKLAEIRSNVRLLHDNSELTTDSLNYDRNLNMAYYFDYGKIVDSVNTLESLHGYYYADTKDYYAVDSVVLVNPDYTMYSDTLKYNTGSEISWFFGPTTIVSDSNLIYCENGWYNTRTDISQYNKNAYLKSTNQTLKGDSLYYDRRSGFGKAYINVELTDTVENVILTGNYALYYEHPEHSLLTDSAVFMQISEGDTMFLHGDTLRYKTVPDTVRASYRVSVADYSHNDTLVILDTIHYSPDTLSFLFDSVPVPTDTLIIGYDSSFTYKLLYAYYRVKVYKTDLQAKCDSMVYTLKDSVIELHYEPVIWSDKNQLTASYIELHTKNNKPYSILMNDLAFIISQEDTLRFNQIKGKNMVGWFRNDSLYKVDVTGNGQSVYYAKEKDEKTGKEKLVGVNKAEASRLIIYLKDNEPDKITFLSKPEGVMNPPEHLSPEELKLKDFIWLSIHRPLLKTDIFSWLGPSRSVVVVVIPEEDQPEETEEE